MEIVERKIIPVGHGAFYCEKFDVINTSVVYDCGTLKGKEFINECIDKTFGCGESIYALFISHFDIDHIKGVEHLLRRCKVKYVILPIVSKLENDLLQLELLLNDCDDIFIKEFVKDPEKSITRITDDSKEKTRIIRVKEWDGEDKDKYEYENDLVDSQNGEIKSGSKVVLKNKDNFKWEYIIYNINQDKYNKKLKSEFDKIDVNWDKNITDPSFWDKKKRNIFKKKYEKIVGKERLNENSLTVLSCPSSGNNIYTIMKCKRWRNHCCYHHCCYHHCLYEYCKKFTYKKAFGCLYTGDFDCKNNWDKLSAAYEKYLHEIMCFQVPHHGSRNNFNKKILELDCIFFMSVKDNDAKHPDQSVLLSFIKNCTYPYLVTENQYSQISLKYHIQ